MKIDGSIDFNLLTSEKAINNHSKLSDNRKKLAVMNGGGNFDNMTRYATPADGQTPSLLITNYDEIIGDFGKELEQEIGAIMAEYSFMREANMSADELLRLKKMRFGSSQVVVPNTTTSTSAIILAQEQDPTETNFTVVSDSPSSNSLVELTTATDRLTTLTNSSSSPPAHHYSPKIISTAAIIQRMRSASACDVRRKELYNRRNERVVNFVNKSKKKGEAEEEAWMMMSSCVNNGSNNSNQNNLIDSNQRYYESIMDHDNKQHNQPKLANPARENFFNVIDTKEMNIFMTTSALSSEYSDDDGCSSDSDTCPSLKNFSHNSSNSLSKPISGSLSSKMSIDSTTTMATSTENLLLCDQDSSKIFTNLARLQIEARMALSQAQSMATMQVELERQKQGTCLITKLVHQTLNKVMRRLPNSKRRLSRWDLGSMNITQLQIIINDFHDFINVLNEILVLYLMERDELSMKQDSILIDIEDITKYIRDKTQYGLAEIMDAS